MSESGLLIQSIAAAPEISTVRLFLAPRQAKVAAGDLARFRGWETSGSTEIFGNVAHCFSAHAKSGTLKGVPFEARGMISTQFVLTPAGWRMSAMAWDDGRPGHSIPDRNDPNVSAAWSCATVLRHHGVQPCGQPNAPEGGARLAGIGVGPPPASVRRASC